MKNILFILLLFTSLGLFAQDNATVQGRITDEFSGDPITFASISLTVDGALVAQTKTNCRGDYHFFDIKEGSYNLSIRKLGFSPVEITDIPVHANEHIVFSPSYEGEGYDGDTIVFSYAEMQNNTSTGFGTPKSQPSKKQLRAARKIN